MNYKPTVLDYAILGLLHGQSMSGYAIRKVFETTALGIYSSSPGTIYPALKRLQRYSIVDKGPVPNSSKQPYKITPYGIKALKTWLLRSIEKRDVEKRKEELFLRFAFMETLLNTKEKIHFLQSFQNHLRIYLAELKRYHKMEADTMPVHGKLSFEHGIASIETSIKWCKKTLLFFEKQ